MPGIKIEDDGTLAFEFISRMKLLTNVNSKLIFRVNVVVENLPMFYIHCDVNIRHSRGMDIENVIKMIFHRAAL